jgi:hypothetical protein
MRMEEALEKTNWPGMETLNSVQDILDRNKLLMKEISHNHEVKSPEALERNAILIRELNSNLSKVVHLYGDLSTNLPDSVGRAEHNGV